MKQTLEVGKERINPVRSLQDIERIVNNLTAGKSINVTKFTERRDFNATTDTVGDMANTLATLISDLKKKGIIR